MCCLVFLEGVLFLDAFAVSLPIPPPSWKPPVMFAKTLKKGELWLCTCPSCAYTPRVQTGQVIDVLRCFTEEKKDLASNAYVYAHIHAVNPRIDDHASKMTTENQVPFFVSIIKAVK